MAGALAQHAEQPAGIGQRAPPGGRHAAHDLGGPLGRAGRRGGRRLAQGDHDGEVVGDDVVHLAGDPGALGGRGERALLVALAFQPVRAVVQFGEVGAAGGGVQAEPERGGDHAGEEDRVSTTSAPPASRTQPDDHGELEQAGARQRVPPRPQRGHRVQGDEQGQAVDQCACSTARPRGSAARTQPNTGMGQIRRTSSGAADRASTMITAAGAGWWLARGTRGQPPPRPRPAG